MARIPVARPDLSGNEENYVLDAVRSSWISSTGKYINQFESEFGKLCGERRAIAVSNGTVALHLALLALDVRPGDEVIVPSLTYIATANAVRYVGGEPIFAEVDRETWCIDPADLEQKITRRTKGIIAVHVYGHPADMDRINHVAAVHGLWVVEDAAEAHFATYKGRVSGSLAQIATFSFYGNKPITSGEGGAIVVSDPQLEKRIRMLRGQGMDPERRYHFPITGYNFRLTNVACALLCAQLERWNQIIAARRHVYDEYRRRLSATPGIEFQPQAGWAKITPWLFSVLIREREFGLTRDALMSQLAEADIETRPFFIPLHTLPPFKRESAARGERLPVTEEIAGQGINLPTFPGLGDDEIKSVCTTIEQLSASARHARR